MLECYYLTSIVYVWITLEQTLSYLLYTSVLLFLITHFLAVCIGGGAGCQGERFAREADGETLNGGGQLWEKVRGTGNWESDCFAAAENYSLEAGGWWSAWVYWWDMKSGYYYYYLSVHHSSEWLYFLG